MWEDEMTIGTSEAGRSVGQKNEDEEGRVDVEMGEGTAVAMLAKAAGRKLGQTGVDMWIPSLEDKVSGCGCCSDWAGGGAGFTVATLVVGLAVVLVVVVVVVVVGVLVLELGAGALCGRTSFRWLGVAGVEQQEPIRKPSAQVPSRLPFDRMHSHENMQVPCSPRKFEHGFSLILRHATDASSDHRCAGAVRRWIGHG